MAKFLALSPKDCEGKRWKVPHDLHHLESHSLIPLHAGEIGKAAASMPVAVVREGAEWKLVGVCGLSADRNLFIKNGEWLGNYRPAWLTTYPFYVMQAAGKGFVVIDESTGLVSEAEGEPFFDQDGKLTVSVSDRVEALKAQQGLIAATQKACGALAQAKVLAPWPDGLVSSTGISIEGLHMVDEKALTQLNEEAFLALRKAQALPLAYALNFSVYQAHLLLRLAKLHGLTNTVPVEQDGDIDLEFLNDGGMISFGKLH